MTPTQSRTVRLFISSTFRKAPAEQGIFEGAGLAAHGPLPAGLPKLQPPPKILLLVSMAIRQAGKCLA